jgi:hypothetical protein
MSMSDVKRYLPSQIPSCSYNAPEYVLAADFDRLRAENDAHEAALLADIGTLRADNERLRGALGHAARMLRGETEVLDQGDAYDRALDILDAALAAKGAE